MCPSPPLSLRAGSMSSRLTPGARRPLPTRAGPLLQTAPLHAVPQPQAPGLPRGLTRHRPAARHTYKPAAGHTGAAARAQLSLGCGGSCLQVPQVPTGAPQRRRVTCRAPRRPGLAQPSWHAARPGPPGRLVSWPLGLLASWPAGVAVLRCPVGLLGMPGDGGDVRPPPLAHAGPVQRATAGRCRQCASPEE